MVKLNYLLIVMIIIYNIPSINRTNALDEPQISPKKRASFRNLLDLDSLLENIDEDKQCSLIFPSLRPVEIVNITVNITDCGDGLQIGINDQVYETTDSIISLNGNDLTINISTIEPVNDQINISIIDKCQEELIFFIVINHIYVKNAEKVEESGGEKLVITYNTGNENVTSITLINEDTTSTSGNYTLNGISTDATGAKIYDIPTSNSFNGSYVVQTLLDNGIDFIDYDHKINLYKCLDSNCKSCAPSNNCLQCKENYSLLSPEGKNGTCLDFFSGNIFDTIESNIVDIIESNFSCDNPYIHFSNFTSNVEDNLQKMGLPEIGKTQLENNYDLDDIVIFEVDPPGEDTKYELYLKNGTKVDKNIFTVQEEILFPEVSELSVIRVPIDNSLCTLELNITVDGIDHNAYFYDNDELCINITSTGISEICIINVYNGITISKIHISYMKIERVSTKINGDDAFISIAYNQGLDVIQEIQLINLENDNVTKSFLKEEFTVDQNISLPSINDLNGTYVVKTILNNTIEFIEFDFVIIKFICQETNCNICNPSNNCTSCKDGFDLLINTAGLGFKCFVEIDSSNALQIIEDNLLDFYESGFQSTDPYIKLSNYSESEAENLITLGISEIGEQQFRNSCNINDVIMVEMIDANGKEIYELYLKNGTHIDKSIFTVHESITLLTDYIIDEIELPVNNAECTLDVNVTINGINYDNFHFNDDNDLLIVNITNLYSNISRLTICAVDSETEIVIYCLTVNKEGRAVIIENNATLREIFSDNTDLDQDYISKNLDTTNTDQLTRLYTYNLSNPTPYPFSQIDLGKSASILMSTYSLDSLIILQVEEKVENSTNNVKFKVYSKEGQLLNLSVIQFNEILISSPTPNNESIKYYDADSPYFNDKCNDTSNSIAKRRQEFKTIYPCNSNCFYTGTNYTANMFICSCNGKNIIENNNIDVSNITHNEYAPILENYNAFDNDIIECFINNNYDSNITQKFLNLSNGTVYNGNDHISTIYKYEGNKIQQENISAIYLSPELEEILKNKTNSSSLYIVQVDYLTDSSENTENPKYKIYTDSGQLIELQSDEKESIEITKAPLGNSLMSKFNQEGNIRFIQFYANFTYKINDSATLMIYEYNNSFNSLSSSNIDLSKCEGDLKNISNSSKIYIGRIDNMVTGNVTYNIYDENGNLLDKSICNETKITEDPFKNIDCDDFSTVPEKIDIDKFMTQNQTTKTVNNSTRIALVEIGDTSSGGSGSSSTAKANNMTEIDLGQCKDKIIEVYSNISEYNVTKLYILQIDYQVKGSTNNAKFDVFDANGKKIDLSVCDNETITVYKPVEGDVTKYDPDYYNEKCTPSDGLTLNQRREQYNNISLCDEGCEFEGVDKQKNAVKCNCKGSAISDNNNKSPTDLSKSVYQDFSSSIKSTNYDVFLCYKLVFSKSLITNIGSYTFIVFFLGNLINFFLYLKNYTYIFAKFIFKRNPPVKKDSNKPQQSAKNIKPSKSIDKNVLPEKDIKVMKTLYSKRDSQRKNLIDNKGKASKMAYNSKLTNDNYLGDSKYVDNSINKFNITNKETSIAKNILKMKGVTPNNLDFLYQKTYEIKETFLTLYLRKLRTYHPIMVIIFREETDILYILISSFIFSIQTDFVSNAFFYEDAYIEHKVEANNYYDLSFSFGKIVISYIFSFLLGLLLNLLTVDLKYNESEHEEVFKNKKFAYELKKLKFSSRLQKTILAYFILLNLFSILFWYYASAFCAVYPKNQSDWIIDSVVSVIITLLMPFASAALSILLRKIALKFDLELLFLITKLLDMSG